MGSKPENTEKTGGETFFYQFPISILAFALFNYFHLLRAETNQFYVC